MKYKTNPMSNDIQSLVTRNIYNYNETTAKRFKYPLMAWNKQVVMCKKKYNWLAFASLSRCFDYANSTQLAVTAGLLDDAGPLNYKEHRKYILLEALKK